MFIIFKNFVSTSKPTPFYPIHLSTQKTARVSDYVELLKPRVMSLVIFTTLCGMMVAPTSPHPVISLIALLSIAVGAGGSGCLNMWIERHTDARMQRTRNRPLPKGIIDPDSALAFGMILSLGSVFLMAVCVNYTASLLLLFTIFFYTVIYTLYLKPRTPYNIVIGGLAGALPPLIGWVSMTGTFDIVPCIMVGIIFFWTVPHFWALALVKAQDYQNAGIPMMPNTHGIIPTKKQILLYTLLTTCTPLALYFIAFNSLWFCGIALILGSVFLRYALRLFTHAHGGEIKLFAYSLFYLFALFLAIVLDHIWVAL